MKHKGIVLITVLLVVQLCNTSPAQPSRSIEAAPDEATKWQSHFPENPEIYVPVPMPEPKQSVDLMSTVFENRLVSYDMLTGKETVLDIDRADLPLQASTKGSPGIWGETPKSDINLMNFTQLSRVDNPQDHPWRVNCKLFFRHGNNYYTGTGILIDPLHVLTAGHCVHDGEGGGWISDMIVLPGYEDEKSPYGDAYGVSLYAWTGWKTFGYSDDDIGIIKLDRPIGAVTGFNGYGYNSNLSFYLNNSFQCAGYPAAEPFDGEFLYFWQGNFDYADFDFSTGRWSGNEVGFSPSAHGGQSGSGVYRTEGPNRVVYAVISNINGIMTFCPRITDVKYNEIEQFIDANTPSNFDLMPLNVTIVPQSIQAGEQLSSISYTVHNYSSIPWSGIIDANIYLSYDDDISTSDTLISSERFWQSLGPKVSKTIEVQSPPTIPAETAKGQYRIGVILDIADCDTTNNDSDGQEAADIVVGFHKLSDNQPEAFLDASMEFALTINTLDWSCIGIGPYDNQDLEVDFFPDFNAPYAVSTEEGVVSDFIAVNGHWLEDSVHYARLTEGGPDTGYAIEAQWHIPDIYLGTNFNDSMRSSEIFQMYEVPLYAGQTCSFKVDVTSGNADLAVYGLKARYGWGSRTYADWTANQSGPGGDETLSFTSDFPGYYGVVIVNENAGSAEYTITVTEN